MSSSNQASSWSKRYNETKSNPVYPTEWVLRMIAGANYPNYKYDKTLYQGKKILDISCGDGRNLELLLHLGFEVYATETDAESVALLSERFPAVKFEVGFNHKHNYPENFFDFALACGSFYYLEKETSFTDNLRELNRICKSGARFFANLTTKSSYVLDNAVELGNGEYLITSDPHNCRDGYRWQTFENCDQIKETFSLQFQVLACSKLSDDYFGYLIENHIIVAENR
jgi:SAM-dependent methyltransferase